MSELELTEQQQMLMTGIILMAKVEDIKPEDWIDLLEKLLIISKEAL